MKNMQTKNVKIYILIIGIFIAMFFLGTKFEPVKKLSLQKLADGIIYKCKGNPQKDVCYEEEIPKLNKKISMEEAFAVTSLIQEKDLEFPYCHVLGHKLASDETKKDPSKWKEVVARCPRGSCSNGCVHGAFQERYKNEVLSESQFDRSIEEFKNICEETEGSKLTGLEQGSCYHALGHLLMYITTANIEKSVSTCDQIAIKDDGRNFTSVCYAGAFMQIFQPLDTDDKSLVSKFKLDSENTWDFCTKFDGQKRVSCREESWPLYLEQISSADGLIKFCGVLDAKGRDACFINILYLMPIQFRFNIPAISHYCSGFPGKLQGMCFAMTASRILEIDKKNIGRTVDFCQSLEEKNKIACFDQVLKDAPFDFGTTSEEYKKLCSLIPDPWKTKCTNNE